jgi:4-hydroxy-tetrahydrodipicolinate synthase
MILEGAMTALVTPMRDGQLDLPALSALVEEQIAAGIDALVAAGTTGESATLSDREQVEVIAAVVAAARGRVPVIAGAGASATAHAIALSRAAADAGADALLHVTPYYNRPNQEGLYWHFGAIADAIDLPIVLYNVPGRTGCDLAVDTVARLARFANVVAIKEATGSPTRASEIIARAGDSIAVLSGDDVTALPLYAVGSRGVISVTSNVAPSQVAAMWDAVVAGDWPAARELHYQLLALTTALFLEPNPIPVKAALALLGQIGPEIRPPLAQAPAAVIDRLAAALRGLGLL